MRDLFFRVLFVFFFLGFMEVFQVSNASGAQCGLSFSGNLEERFNDNIYFSETDPSQDYLTIISPRLGQAYKTARTQLALSAGVTHYAYQEYSQSDNTDQHYSGSWTYRWGQRFQTHVNAGYNDDQRMDRILEETGLITDEVHRQAQDYGLGGQFELSELSSVTVSYTFQSEMYDASGIDDMIGHTISLGLFRNLNGRWIRTTGSLQLRFNQYKYSNAYTIYENYLVLGEDGLLRLETVDIGMEQTRNIDSFSCFLGIDHSWTEKFKMIVSAGARYTQYEYEIRQNSGFYQQTIEVEQEDELQGFVGTLNLDYNGLFTSYSIYLSHDLVPASGQNGITERTQLGLNSNWHPLQEWHLGISSSAFLNRSEETDVVQDIDQLTMTLSGSIRYLPNHFWSIGLQYTYYCVEDRNEDIQRYRNTALLSIGWNLPLYKSD